MGSKATKSLLYNSDVHQGQILAMITVLRKIATSPRLLINDEATMKNLDLNIVTSDLEKDVIDGSKPFICKRSGLITDYHVSQNGHRSQLAMSF